MDKVARHAQAIRSLLEEYAAIKKSVTPDVRTEVVMDSERHHYQLLSIGWHKQRFNYVVAFHFDIIGEKIWIQQNNTDVMVADELMERGVAQSDIVLGFVSPKARAFSEFAVA
jgi:hypothetical protein